MSTQERLLVDARWTWKPQRDRGRQLQRRSVRLPAPVAALLRWRQPVGLGRLVELAPDAVARSAGQGSARTSMSLVPGPPYA